jgi:hypothetical protein
MDKMTLVFALLSLVLGLGFLGRYLYLDYKSKQEKSFIVVGLGILAFWFFGGNILLIIAVMLFMLLLFRGC